MAEIESVCECAEEKYHGNPFRYCSCGWMEEAEITDHQDIRVKDDPVNHPSHYTQYGVEVIEITEQLNFNLGNAVKYILRADFKGNREQDLSKAVWYLERELKRGKS